MSKEFNESEKVIVEKIDLTVELLRTNKITLLTDLDGSRVRTAQKAIETFNIANGTSYKEENMTYAFAMVDWARKLGKGDPTDYAVSLWNSDVVMSESNPVTGAIELSSFLYNHRNARVVIPGVTARPVRTRVVTEVWHKKWMGMNAADFKKRIFMQTDDRISPGFKINTIAGLAPTYYFEDQIADAEAIVKASPATTVILISQPWNQNYVVPTDFKDRILKPENIDGRAKVLDSFYTLVQHATK